MIFNSILHLLCEAAVASRNSKRSWRAHLFHDSHGLGNVKESEIKPRVTGHGGHELTHERHGSRLSSHRERVAVYLADFAAPLDTLPICPLLWASMGAVRPA